MMLKQQTEMPEMGKKEAKMKKGSSYFIKFRRQYILLFFGLLISLKAWSTVDRWPDEISDNVRVFCVEGSPGFSLVKRLKPETIWTEDVNQCEFHQVDPPFDFEGFENQQGQACLHTDHVSIDSNLTIKVIIPLKLDVRSALTGEEKEGLLNMEVLKFRLFKLNEQTMLLEPITPEMSYDMRSLIQLSDDPSSLDPDHPIHLNFEKFITSPDWIVNVGDRVSARIDFCEPTQTGFTTYDVKVGNQMRWISSAALGLTQYESKSDEVFEF